MPLNESEMKLAADNLRRLIAGALCDFVGHLDELKDPIIVGERYSRDRLIDAFTKWTMKRGINVKDANAEGWISGCNRGVFKAPMEDTDDSAE